MHSTSAPDAGMFQRFRSSTAYLAPHFDRIVGNVLDRFMQEFPAAPGVAFRTKRGRFDLATDFAMVVKHMENPVMVHRTLKKLGAWLDESGMTRGEMGRFQAMIVREAKEAAGNTWSDQLEADWNGVVRSVLAHVPVPATKASRAAA